MAELTGTLAEVQGRVRGYRERRVRSWFTIRFTDLRRSERTVYSLAGFFFPAT